MVNRPRFPRQARILLLLSICLLILGAIPTPAAQAAVVPQAVDNALSDFTRGTFQRSSLSALRVNTPSGDVSGAVQLLPIGILKDWINSPFDLPDPPRTDIGAVAINNHIFVIGGTATVGTGLAPIPDVLSVTIDQSTGAPQGSSWSSEPSLPAIQTSDSAGATALTAGRAVPAVAAVQSSTDPNSGYIYVMGGNVRPTGTPDSISSYGVNIARVVNGHIDTTYAPATNGWATGPRIPDIDPLFSGIGLQSASALKFTTGGKTYIYLFGGLMRYRESGTHEVASNKVFYAQVAANGQLVKPSNPATAGWDKLADIPVSDPSSMGVWDGTLVADHFDVGGGVGGDALYLMGGQLRPGPPTNDGPVVYNNAVFRALINSNGTITWQTDNPQLTMPEARTGLAGVEFRGNLYLTGGRPINGSLPGAPQKSILTSYVEDDLKLAEIGQGSTFLRNIPDPLPLPRARHGSVVVPATPTPEAPNAAYVYVIAGQGDPNDSDPRDDVGSKTMIFGRIGAGEDTTTNGFARSGWYYSAPHDTVFQGAQVQEVRWTTVITRPTMDIQMEYRITRAGDCNDPNAFTGAGTEWQALDGSPGDAFLSLNGANVTVLGTGLEAHCFQYRAKLTSDGSPPKQTPALLNVSLLINVPGSPDLKVLRIDDQRGRANSLTGLYATILNHNDAPNSPTQPADLESGGSFFVDLFVFAPGQTPTAPVLPLTDNNRQGSKAYANIAKSSMGKDVSLQITQWCKPDAFPCQPLDVLSLFPNPGTYTVYVAVDSYNYVVETPTSPAEQNNILQKVIQVPSISHDSLVPLVYR